MKMRKFILLCVSAAIFCTSCVYSVPNDRAVYGLYGPVESMEDGAEKIFFTADGSFSPGTYAGLGVAMKTCSYGKVHLVFVDGSEQICRFDKLGRLIKEIYIDAEAVFQTKYEYTYDKSSDKVPSYLKATSVENGEPVVIKGYFQCGAVDSLGNWTSMAWNGDVFTRVITYYPEGTAVTENCPMERFVDWQLVGFALAVLLVFLILAWMVRMAYVRFIRKR